MKVRLGLYLLWLATTSLPQTTSSATSVVYNGYVYEIGGDNLTNVLATVYYAPILSSGALGSWTATTSLPVATDQATSVAYNGYVYEIGGYNSGGSALTTVDYLDVNPSPTPVPPISNTATTNTNQVSLSWNSVPGASVYNIYRSTSPTFSNATEYVSNTNSFTDTNIQQTSSLLQTTEVATSVVYNGYVYEIGGYSSGVSAIVDYAPINSNGILGSWTATTPLPVATMDATSVVYNGYVYEIGGCNNCNPSSTVYYASINSNGTLGTWNATTPLLAATDGATSVVYNGYVYEIGGYNGSAYVATVDYAPINSNGTIGTWTATTPLLVAVDLATSVVYNGYVYEIGGWNGSANFATVDYAPINSNGTIGSWTATTSLPVATSSATSVVYNGYVYEIGGDTTATVATVDYAPHIIFRSVRYVDCHNLSPRGYISCHIGGI